MASGTTGTAKLPNPSWAAIASISPHPRKCAETEAADRAEHGDDDGLPPQCRPQLPAGLADGAEQAELAGAFVDRQRNGVGDSHHADQHGQSEQRVHEGEHLVDLGGDGVDALVAGLGLGCGEAVGDDLDGGPAVGEVYPVGEVDEDRTSDQYA